jgi:flavin reductase (DIM6/NTAB) family NADH-FMN oxidoreductase RutF
MSYKTEKDVNIVKPLASNPVIIVTTLNSEGEHNAAAFNSYMNIGSTIIISFHPECHTFKNIIESKEFVVHVPSLDEMESIMVVSRNHRDGVDKFKSAKLTLEPSLKVKPYTIVDYPASIECRFKWTQEEGEYNLLAAEILACKCDDAFLNPKGRFDQVKAGVLHIVRFPDPIYIVAEHYIQGIEEMR